MLRTNSRCVASLNISVEVAKCGKFSQIHPEHSLLSVTKYDLSRLNNLFMVSFQLIRMSSYAKNKLQMCWVTQRQCRSRQMWKIFTNSPSTLTFYLLQKMTCLDWTIHSWQAFNSLVCTLMLRTNNRCVESLNISVMSPNVENIHKFTQYTDYFLLQKKGCHDWTIYSW